MNITGIELLNKTEIMKTMPNVLFLIIMGVAFLVCLVMFLISIITDDDDFLTPTVVSFLVGLLFVFLSTNLPDKIPTGRYEYEVYVSENADVVQLYKNYEFVECRGDIYTFRDPEVEDGEDSCCDCDKHSYKNECSHHDRVSPENTKKHNHTHKQKHGCIEENSENSKAEVPNEPETPAEDIGNVCDNCNAILEKNDKFCSQCGHKRKEE